MMEFNEGLLTRDFMNLYREVKSGHRLLLKGVDVSKKHQLNSVKLSEIELQLDPTTVNKLIEMIDEEE